MAPDDQYQQLFRDAFRGRVTEISLSDVLQMSGEERVLPGIQKITRDLSNWGLVMDPNPVDDGDLETPRYIRLRSNEEVKPKILERLEGIIQHEHTLLEMKSSLVFHHNRARKDPNASKHELKSDEVLHSALKSIPALMNANGGELIIGIDDDKNVVGIEYDFEVIRTGSGVDQWEGFLRDKVKTVFRDGMSICSALSIKYERYEKGTVAIISCPKRRHNLTLMKHYLSGKYELYVRQGQRTAEYGMADIEEFLADWK